MVGSPLNNPINTTPPTKYLSQVANPFMQPWQLYMLPAPNSTAQPTTPASPTNTWWMMFALPGGQGYYHVQVVPDGSVTDASQQISISEAQSLGYNVQMEVNYGREEFAFPPDDDEMYAPLEHPGITSSAWLERCPFGAAHCLSNSLPDAHTLQTSTRAT